MTARLNPQHRPDVRRDPLLPRLRTVESPIVSGYWRVMREIEGWFAPEDVLVFDKFNELQMKRGVSGDLLEIGTYMGQSAILLGQFRRQGEKVVVCDLFGDPALSRENQLENAAMYSGLERQAFERNYLRFHSQLPTILQCPSERVLQYGLSRSFRLIRIDGSHLYDPVSADIATAKELLLPSGIVIFDDYREWQAPGVTAAVWEAVTTRGLRPICLTPHKMYASWSGSLSEEELALLEQWAESFRYFKVRRHALLGFEFLLLEPTRWLQQMVSSSRNPRSRMKRVAFSMLPPVLVPPARRLLRFYRQRKGTPARR